MKYELTTTKNEQGLFQIRALRDIPRHGVKKGDLGGWAASEYNLSQYGDAWVSGNARVFGDARVSDESHTLVISTIGGHSATLFRTENAHQIQAGCTLTTVDELMSVAIDEFGKDSPYLLEVEALIGLFKTRIASWERK